MKTFSSITASSPEWQSDREVDACLNCSEPFSLFFRRHHCRSCGHIFCYSCSTNTLQGVRVCDGCFTTYTTKNETCN